MARRKFRFGISLIINVWFSWVTMADENVFSSYSPLLFSSKLFEVKLSFQSEQDIFGFSLFSDQPTGDFERPNFIHWVFNSVAGGLAEKTGCKDGDVIRGINGCNIDFLTHDEVIGLLRNAKKRRQVCFILERSNGLRYIEMESSLDGMRGLTIESVGNQYPFWINYVECGSIGEKRGFQVGDRIEFINGYSVRYKTHEEMIYLLFEEALKKQERTVILSSDHEPR